MASVWMTLEILRNLNDKNNHIFKVIVSNKKIRIIANQKFLGLGNICHIYNITEVYFSRNMRTEGTLMIFFI